MKPPNMTALARDRRPVPLDIADVAEPEDYGQALLDLLGSPNNASRRWVWEQYDTLIQGNSLQIPGGDAGVVRVEGTTQGAGLLLDVTPRYVEADPFEGGKQAVAECWRNLTATGAEPLAATDNLNFGNPERPEIMGQLVWPSKASAKPARRSASRSSRAMSRSTTRPMARRSCPRPTIGGVGLICRTIHHMARIGGANAGDAVILIGGDGSHLGQSAWMRDCLGRAEGAPPTVDLMRRAPQRRFRPLRHPQRPGHRLPRYFLGRSRHDAGRNALASRSRHGA
jgi:phosphoribosylformylglycinamidine (FGAM) synthase-like enzyme